MVRATKLLVIGAAVLVQVAAPMAQAQQNGANSRRSDSSCIRLEQALSWMMSKVSSNGDWCRVRPREDALSSRSERVKGSNSVRVAQNNAEQIN